MSQFIRTRLAFTTILVLLALSGLHTPALAQSCGTDHMVVRGNTLSLIADKVYRDTSKWTVIYTANIPIIGPNPDRLEIGQILRIPCIDGSVTREESTNPAVQVNKNPESAAPNAIRFLTGDDYEPFTDRKLLNGGLITDIIVSALGASPAKPEFRVAWENDWSKHLSPLLSDHSYDVGFPWLQPDCVNSVDDYRCKNFLFSSPMFQFLVLLYVNKNQVFTFNTDSDMEGKTLCRPKGYFTHDLEKDGRFWLSQNKVTLRQPDTINDCFVQLREGQVDAVALNEFTGRAAIKRLALKDKVDIIESRPLSIESLHMVVHKKHPKAKTLIQLVNNSLTDFQLSPLSEKVIDIHMTNFWSDFL